MRPFFAIIILRIKQKIPIAPEGILPETLTQVKACLIKIGQTFSRIEKSNITPTEKQYADFPVLGDKV